MKYVVGSKLVKCIGGGFTVVELGIFSTVLVIFLLIWWISEEYLVENSRFSNENANPSFLAFHENENTPVKNKIKMRCVRVDDDRTKNDERKKNGCYL